MAINLTNLAPPKAPATPTLSKPDDQKKKIDQLKKDQKQVHDLSKDITKTVTQVNKTMENAFGKAAKQICLLRLDMIADILDKINPRLASQIDAFSNAFETSNWGH